MTNSANIILVDDNPITHELIEGVLTPEGFHLISAYNGVEALKLAESMEFDLVLLDIMMPGMDGFTVCAELRTRGQTPVMMVTALDEANFIALAYSLGADDYLCQPCESNDLLARIAAILQRNDDDPEPSPLPPDLSANLQHAGIVLTRIESRLLSLLANTPDQPYSQDDIFRHVWGYDAPEGQALVDAAVQRLREKIEGSSLNSACIRSLEEGYYIFKSVG